MASAGADLVDSVSNTRMNKLSATAATGSVADIVRHRGHLVARGALGSTSNIVIMGSKIHFLRTHFQMRTAHSFTCCSQDGARERMKVA